MMMMRTILVGWAGQLSVVQFRLVTETNAETL